MVTTIKTYKDNICTGIWVENNSIIDGSESVKIEKCEVDKFIKELWSMV